MAVNRQKPQSNLIFHSDRGVQYASLEYREALAKHNITQSMSGKGDPYDNAVAENFFSCLKCELVHHKHYRTRAEAPLGLLSSFALQSYRQRSPASKPWNKCDNFYENERIITIHSVFCSFLLSIFSGRARAEI